MSCQRISLVVTRLWVASTVSVCVNRLSQRSFEITGPRGGSADPTRCFFYWCARFEEHIFGKFNGKIDFKRYVSFFAKPEKKLHKNKLFRCVSGGFLGFGQVLVEVHPHLPSERGRGFRLPSMTVCGPRGDRNQMYMVHRVEVILSLGWGCLLCAAVSGISK